jgi:tetratricopeptide (TPR) repeat protein
MMNGPDDLLPEFKLKLAAAKGIVSSSRASGDLLALANALKELGNIERRPPQLRDDANRTFAEAAELYCKLEMPLEAAWVLRHIGINHEYADDLTEAEKYYDESLGLFRQHADENDNNYANTVRYPAVIKDRIGKRDVSTALWQEAVRRYDAMGQPLGVAEGAAWLAIFAVEKGDRELASEWFTKAEQAANLAKDRDTDNWITEVRARLMDEETDGR